MMELNCLCDIYSGYAFKSFNDTSDGIPVIKIGNILSDGTIELTDCVYTEEVPKEKYYSKKDDIYIALSGATTGKIGVMQTDGLYVINQRVGIIRNKGKIPNDYLKYFLVSKSNQILKEASGCAQPNISPKQISKYDISIQTEEKMLLITQQLKKIEVILQNYRNQIDLLDELVKARFVELFGDVRSNNNYPNVLFSECVEHSLRGPFGSDMKKSLYVPKNENTIKVYIQINAIQKNENLGDYYISKEYYDDKMYKFEVFPNEYIITCDGTLGKLLKLSKNMEKGVISSSLLKLKLNYSLITDQYFEYVWNLCLLPQLISEARNACLVHLPSMKVIGSKKIQLPPLELQNQFADFVKEVDKSAIDEFSDPNKLPQIAISVDMLDTGIDVPEVLNLVFFKKVMSKAKFWQMIGRGTRLCPYLMDGSDKKIFYIFDFCGNFEFFRMNKGNASSNTLPIQGAIFNLKFQIAYKLQDIVYQTEELISWRKELVDYMVGKVQELNRDNFAVRQHLKYVDLYSNPDNYVTLSYEDSLMISQELAHLILPDEDEITAVRFDALMYEIELAFLAGKKYTKGRTDLVKKVKRISKVSNIPEIKEQSELINQILHTTYLKDAGINEFEYIRKKLRELIKYIPKQHLKFDTNFEDDILSREWHESNLESDDLKNYRNKVEYYIRKHEMDNPVILKLKTNKPLNKYDLKNLENVLWGELGTKEQYYSEYGEKPLGEFVREIVGLDMNSAKEAFSLYLNDTNLSENQIYFVNQIIEYIVRNGVLKDLSVLQESPFIDKGTVVDLFGNDIAVWQGISGVINSINQNALFV